ncbi:MAG: hypothetical protein ACTHMG_10900 [Sphingomonas sp.]
MTTPAILPAAMISLVALAATHDRRDRAAAVWFGMAVALSGWVLLPASAAVLVRVRRTTLVHWAPAFLLALGATTIVLRAAGLPHSSAVMTVSAALTLSLFALLLPRIGAGPSSLAHRIG